MAIEIRELVIRARIEPRSESRAQRPVEKRRSRHGRSCSTVEDLFRIMRDKQER